MSEAMQALEAKKNSLLQGFLTISDIDKDSVLHALAKIYKVPCLDLNHVEIDDKLIEKCLLWTCIE